MKDFDFLFSRFSKLSSKELIILNQKGGWSLNLRELRQIQDYYKNEKREPSRAEIETIAQTWSEHCKHKTFSGPVKLITNKGIKRYKNLFKETIVKATKTLNRKWCLSVFQDNAGVVELSGRSKWAAAFKAETHNHPCAIEPYGGAETGVGGVIRDILGVGLGAKPVLNTDVFCFAPPDSKIKLAKHNLPPKRIFSKVVEGVRDYGNRMGIPTAAGGVFFDEGYALNPLVYVGSVGIIEKDKIRKKIRRGDLIVVIGGRTGRDGIHGATFSSANLDENVSSSTVQIGHPLNEKKVLDALMRAKTENLYTAITDCGAGGFSSAIGELARDLGAVVFLERAPLKDISLEPWEIWVSESQERMVLSVPKNKLPGLEEILREEICEHCVLGEFTDDKRLIVKFKGSEILNLDLLFLHHELPKIEKTAVYIKPPQKTLPPKKPGRDYSEILREILSHPNVCSRKSIIRQYDFEVQGGTVVKPLLSPNDSPCDAVVIWPHSATGDMKDYLGFAVSHGFNPLIGKLDAKQMAIEAVDEAIRNLLCVGADIERASLMDNFCAGDPSDKKMMGAFAVAAEALLEASLSFKAPFISGKDSFYNQSKDARGREKSIPLSLLISAIAPVQDIRKSLTINFKKPGNPVYIVGQTKPGMGASIYNEVETSGNTFVSASNPRRAQACYKKILLAIRKGCVAAAHDISQGGLLTTLTEMGFGRIGVEIDIRLMPAERGTGEVERLFGESSSRIVLEVRKKEEKNFIRSMKGVAAAKIGYTTKEPVISVSNGSRLLLRQNTQDLFLFWNRELP